jgi:hypothetical protein
MKGETVIRGIKADKRDFLFGMGWIVRGGYRG